MSDPRDDPEFRLLEEGSAAVLVRLTLTDLDDMLDISATNHNFALSPVLRERLEKARDLLAYAEARARLKR